MEEYTKVYSNDNTAMMRVPVNPDIMAWIDNENKKGWIVVKDTPENIDLFNKKYKDVKSLDGVKIFYNEPYFYDLIEDGLHTRAKIKKERERQEALENPKVWQEVEDIETKEQLIEYLMDYWYTTNHADIWEYSSDIEVADKRLTVTAKELDRKIKELL